MSLLWAFAGPEVASVASIAHVEAVAVALDFLERRAGTTRQQVDGERLRIPTGMAAATFVHRTSREGDPQLHSHCVGAQDFEQGPAFGGPAPDGPRNARAWVAGFESAANGRRYINFGSADGCPTSGATAAPQRCETGSPEFHTGAKAWTQDDYKAITQGVPSARGGFVQIYNIPAMSQQWQQISVYTHESATVFDVAGSIEFLGALTQVGACSSPTRSCDASVKTPPPDAWTDFKSKLDADARTKQPLGYSSDIKWQGG